ncbi:MAG: hypothetical protein HY075_01915 [Deltaproteobacteria bacterium]|nr:hypothetical protein [Deltaproteobacteria bacterium]
MYFSFGTESAVETLVALSKPYAPDRKIGSARELKAAYLRFLEHYQPQVPAPVGGTPIFATDADLVEHLAGFFRVKSWLNDKSQGRMIEGQFSDVLDRTRRLERGFSELSLVAPEFVEVFEIAINYVFCASSTLAGGGTTSSALGVIWAAHRNAWSKTDIFEFFVHELTHNMVFLDECRFRHYPDYASLSMPENFVQSAILSIPRPLDKVVHSLMVATEVLLFREQVSGHPVAPALHPKTDILLAKATRCLTSLDSLKNYAALLTPRGRLLVERAKSVVAMLSAKHTVNEYDDANFRSVPLEI